MLFEAERDGHVIHLFGGSRPTTTAWSSTPVETIAASSDEFWNEVPAMGPEVQLLASKYGIDPSRTLRSWLSPGDVDDLEAASRSSGVDRSMLAALRPWLAAQVLRMADDVRLGLKHENGAEALLTRIAIDAGVPVRSEFATAEDVLASFGSMSRDAELQYLRFTFYEISSGPERLREHAEALAVGDMTPIEEETAMMRREWPALHEHLVVRRNYAWLPRMDKMLRTGVRAFVVVGTGHLVGEEGLLALLTGSGASVRRRP